MACRKRFQCSAFWLLAMGKPKSLVCVVDDDELMQELIRRLVEAPDKVVHTYASAQAFVDDPAADACDCLVLDVCMPGVDGMVLLERLVCYGASPPTVVISGYADVAMAVGAMQLGAIDFLVKPFDSSVLLDRIDQAIEQSAVRRQLRSALTAIGDRVGSLTKREADVLELMVKGHTNKMIANMLGISVRTVEQHRARVMGKMRVNSLADLVTDLTRLRTAPSMR